jgi:polyhydroxybutyrate depolymerase
MNNVDDVGFVRSLLDDVQKVARVDPKRVYATGMSNGSIFCYRLASQLSDRIAAIAPVSGPMGTKTCHPGRPVPVIHFHGTADEFAPFHGGRGPKSLAGINFYSVEHSIDAWIRADGCPPEPKTEKLSNKVKDAPA